MNFSERISNSISRRGSSQSSSFFHCPDLGGYRYAPRFCARIFPSESKEMPRFAPSTFSSTTRLCRRKSKRSDSERTLSSRISTSGSAARCGVDGNLKNYRSQSDLLLIFIFNVFWAEETDGNTDILQCIFPAPPFAICRLQNRWFFRVSICNGNKLAIRYIEIY